MSEQSDLLNRGKTLLHEIDTLKMRINGLWWRNPYANEKLRDERIEDLSQELVAKVAEYGEVKKEFYELSPKKK